MNDPNALTDQNKQRIMKSHLFDEENETTTVKPPPKTHDSAYKSQYTPSPRATQHNYTPTLNTRNQQYAYQNSTPTKQIIKQIDPIPPTPPLPNIVPFPDFKFEPLNKLERPDIAFNKNNDINSTIDTSSLIVLGSLREKMSKESAEFAERMKNLIIYEQQPSNSFTRSMNMSGTLNGSQKLTVEGEFIMPNGTPFT